MTQRTQAQLDAENRQLHSENAALKNEIVKLRSPHLTRKNFLVIPLADSAPVMIWVTGREGECQFANRAFCEFFHKRMENVLGFRCEAIRRGASRLYT
jgi:cell division protein FtsB